MGRRGRSDEHADLAKAANCCDLVEHRVRLNANHANSPCSRWRVCSIRLRERRDRVQRSATLVGIKPMGAALGTFHLLPARLVRRAILNTRGTGASCEGRVEGGVGGVLRVLVPVVLLTPVVQHATETLRARRRLSKRQGRRWRFGRRKRWLRKRQSGRQLDGC